MKALWFSAMSGTTHPTTQYHIIGDWIFRNTDMRTSNLVRNSTCITHKVYLYSLQHIQLLHSAQQNSLGFCGVYI